MNLKLWITVLVLLIVTGCAAIRPPALTYRPADYRYAEDGIFIMLYWNCLRPNDRALAIQGFAESPIRADRRVYYLTLRLLGYDEKGNLVSKAHGQTRSPSIGIGEVSPFMVELPLKGNVVRIDLEYQYGYYERNGDLERRTSWRPLPLRATYIEFRSTVRDICK